PLKSVSCNQLRLVVILVVLTDGGFRFSLLISQLLAKAIPVRGAKFKKPAFEQAFCFSVYHLSSVDKHLWVVCFAYPDADAP
ncbi:TPA: hypothetical protein ACIJVY_004769, partial [Klebsiella pneumoniae]